MPFGSLWLPVVVSAVAVWILSAVLHMVLRYHKADYKPLSDEDSVAQALGKSVRGPGVYFLPYCAEMSQMKDPAIRKKFEDCPVAILTVLRNGTPTMGKNRDQQTALFVTSEADDDRTETVHETSQYAKAAHAMGLHRSVDRRHSADRGPWEGGSPTGQHGCEFGSVREIV